MIYIYIERESHKAEGHPSASASLFPPGAGTGPLHHLVHHVWLHHKSFFEEPPWLCWAECFLTGEVTNTLDIHPDSKFLRLLVKQHRTHIFKQLLNPTEQRHTSWIHEEFAKGLYPTRPARLVNLALLTWTGFGLKIEYASCSISYLQGPKIQQTKQFNFTTLPVRFLSTHHSGRSCHLV